MFNFKRYYFEWNTKYRPAKSLIKYKYFDGYWQSWQHIDYIFESLKKDFTPNYQLNKITQTVLESVKKQNSVFVGVRIGDYVNDSSKFGSFKDDYYLFAMN